MAPGQGATVLHLHHFLRFDHLLHAGGAGGPVPVPKNQRAELSLIHIIQLSLIHRSSLSLPQVRSVWPCQHFTHAHDVISPPPHPPPPPPPVRSFGGCSSQKGYLKRTFAASKSAFSVMS